MRDRRAEFDQLDEALDRMHVGSQNSRGLMTLGARVVALLDDVDPDVAQELRDAIEASHE